MILVRILFNATLHFVHFLSTVSVKLASPRCSSTTPETDQCWPRVRPYGKTDICCFGIRPREYAKAVAAEGIFDWEENNL